MTDYQIVERGGTVLCGFVSDPWTQGYKPCCRKTANWEGYGDWQTLLPDQTDPYYTHGYRMMRGVRCSVCGYDQNAHELKGDNDERASS